MTIQKSDSGMQDILGCSKDFLEALAQPELSRGLGQTVQQMKASGGTQRAALWLAVALGRCRIFGINLSDKDGVLPGWIAIAAAKELLIQTRNLMSKIKEWAEQHEQQDPDPDDGLVEANHFFFIWMDLWAAFVSLDEAFQACLINQDDACKEFRHIMASLNEGAEALDEEAQNHTDLLCAVAETNMFNTWRSLLVEPYKSLVPWWLGDMLETEAKCKKLRQMSQL